MPFPTDRPRRLRRTEAMRSFVQIGTQFRELFLSAILALPRHSGGARIFCYAIPNRSSPPPASHGSDALICTRNQAQSRRLRLSSVRLPRRRRAQGSALHARRLQSFGGRSREGVRSEERRVGKEGRS